MADDVMAFPDTWEEFEKHYGFYDSKRAYTYGNTRLIPSFRVQQWLDHIEANNHRKAAKKLDRVSDEWLEDMLRLYNAVCTSEGNLQMYRAFYELKQRREAEGPINGEVVDDLFIDDVLSSPDGGEIMRRSYTSVRLALIELQARRKAEK